MKGFTIDSKHQQMGSSFLHLQSNLTADLIPAGWTALVRTQATEASIARTACTLTAPHTGTTIMRATRLGSQNMLTPAVTLTRRTDNIGMTHQGLSYPDRPLFQSADLHCLYAVYMSQLMQFIACSSAWLGCWIEV